MNSWDVYKIFHTSSSVCLGSECRVFEPEAASVSRACRKRGMASMMHVRRVAWQRHLERLFTGNCQFAWIYWAQNRERERGRDGEGGRERERGGRDTAWEECDPLPGRETSIVVCNLRTLALFLIIRYSILDFDFYMQLPQFTLGVSTSVCLSVCQCIYI